MYPEIDGRPPEPFLKEFPDENDIYLLNPDGTPTIKVNVGRLENSQYWESKYRIIGVVLFLSFLYFVMTLLGETKIMEQAWQSILGVLGPLMPQLPKLW